MNKIVIRTGDLAHPTLKIICILIFLFSVYKLINLSVLGLVLSVVAVGLWTAREIVVVDFHKKIIGEGHWILGLSSLEKTRFSELEKIFINRVKSTTRMNHLIGSADITDYVYKAFLKTAEGEKFEIATGSDKDKVIRKLKEYNKVLKTVIIDSTLPEPVVVG